MILIADSGSTKTAWRLINGNTIQQFETSGINPNSMSKEACLKSLTQLTNLLEASDIQRLYYYGAGVNNSTIEQWESTLSEIFQNATISVENDLMAAAKACFGNESGLVGILGTGSNVGLFNGEAFDKKAPALGYILGDEGAGVSIGKAIIKGFYRGSWSEELKAAFRRKFPWHTYDSFVADLYTSEQKAAFLAQFSKWAFQQRKHQEITLIVTSVFEEYFEMLSEVFGQEHKTLALVGSVAYYWGDYIKKIGQKHGYTISTIIESPIAALTLYHQNHA